MQQDVTTMTLGRLRWVAEAGVWSGELRLSSQRAVPVEVVPAGEHVDRPDDPAVFAVAEATAAWLKSHRRQTLLAVADNMVGSYNERTAGEQEPVTAAEFARWIEIAGVRISSQGGFILTLGDRDTALFGDLTAIADFDESHRLTMTFVS